MLEFAFDLKLDVAVRIEAETFEDAVKFLKDNLDCAWAEFKQREGDEPTVYGEATLNGEVTKDMLFEPEVCPECEAIEDTSEWGTVGDGYDGYCPNCADKREREGVYDL